MKLISKRILLQMPKGTVFAKKTRVFTETSPILVLGDCSDRDFYYINISSFCFGESDLDTDDAFFALDRSMGRNIEMELCVSRDGLFDDDEMYYVFSKKEVEQMIDVLTEALKVGYDKKYYEQQY